MTIGTHNSWTYLKPRQWYAKPFNFMAKCQNDDIRTQYEKHGARCFDLRIRLNTKDNTTTIAHGMAEYDLTWKQLEEQLEFLNGKEDAKVRVLHETRNKRQHTEERIKHFQKRCRELEENYKDITFFGGENLTDWTKDYTFKKQEPTYIEKHGSVSKLKYAIGWFPLLYAKLFNKRNKQKQYKEEIILLDFIDVE